MITSKAVRRAALLIIFLFRFSVINAEEVAIAKTAVYLKGGDDGKDVYENEALELIPKLHDETLLSATVSDGLLVGDVFNNRDSTIQTKEWNLPTEALPAIDSPLPSDWEFRLDQKTRLLVAASKIYVILPSKHSRKIYDAPKGTTINSVSPLARNGLVLLYVSHPGDDNSSLEIFDVAKSKMTRSFPLSNVEFTEAFFWLNDRFAVGLLNTRSGVGAALVDLNNQKVTAEERLAPGVRLQISDSAIFAFDQTSNGPRRLFEDKAK